MEVLRIVAMLMIVTLHFLDKGGILKEFTLKMGFNDNLAWVFEALCMVSVNIYVLISGYFLSESEFKVKKVLMLWLQILFYSWIITAVFAIVTKGNLHFENGIYDLIPLVLPVTGNHYWFATIYILLYLFFPFLNKLTNALDKKNFKSLLIIGICVFSVWNTFLPFTIPVTDREGMDICWFVVLYLTASYIRKYPEDFKLNKWVYLLIYFACGVSAFALGKGLLLADTFIGKLGGFARNFYPYNSAFIFVGSVALFLFAVKSEFKCENFFAKVILFLSQGTFGVYLLHEHHLLRYLWPTWFNSETLSGRFAFVYVGAGIIVTVFIVGVIIDSLRRLIFGIFDKKK